MSNQYVEAAPLHHIGHSYTKLPYAYSRNTYATEYGLRVRERLSMGDYHWHGRPGTPAEAMVARLVSPTYDSGSGLWEQGTKGIVMIENYTNELGSSNSADTDYRNLWSASIRGEVAIAQSEYIHDWTEKSATSGTWTQYNSTAAVKALGGKTYYGGVGAFVEFTVESGDEAWVATVISKTSYAIASLAFSCNGSSVGTFNGDGLKPAYTDPILGADQNMTMQLVRVSGLNAAAGTSGSKTLRITITGSGNGFLSGIVVPSASPPAVFIAKEPPRGYPPTTIWTDNHAYFDDEIDTIATEFANVFVVDLNDGWDGSSMISSLDTSSPPIHPNDIGQSHLADKFVDAINTNITYWDEGIVTI